MATIKGVTHTVDVIRVHRLQKMIPLGLVNSKSPHLLLVVHIAGASVGCPETFQE